MNLMSRLAPELNELMQPIIIPIDSTEGEVIEAVFDNGITGDPFFRTTPRDKIGSSREFATLEELANWLFPSLGFQERAEWMALSWIGLCLEYRKATLIHS